ncbi:MAG: hypothetical protein M3Y87_26525 [Myxococcota bacterium]|nr:hypothetical protein [Myxococcota bacterium]
MGAPAGRSRSFEELYREILSPGSVRDDRLKKLRIYALVAQEGETASLPPFDLPIEIDAIWGPRRGGPSGATRR